MHMNYLEEENKNLMNLRTSLIPTVVVLTGGIVGLFLASIDLWAKAILILAGIYFEILFISDITYANRKINENIGVIKNEYK